MPLATLVSEKQLFYQYMHSQDQNQSLHSCHYFTIIVNGTAELGIIKGVYLFLKCM